MNTEFINTDNLPLEEARLLPTEEWFTPDELQREQELQHIRATAPNHDALIVSDIDADGLGCVTVAETALNDVGFIPGGPHGPTLDLAEVFQELAEHTTPTTTVFVCDISPDADTWKTLQDSIELLANNTKGIVWCDHHNYSDSVQTALTEYVTEFRLGDSDTKCATDMLYEFFTDTRDPDWPAHITDLVTVTRDRDCWIREDERNADIADFAELADHDRYVSVVKAHGPDLTPEIHTELSEYRETKEQLIELAVQHTTIYPFDVSDSDEFTTDTIDVGMVYGRCPSSETAEAIRETHNADAVVMVKPSGAVSLRGSDTFQECAAIASRFGGGGHDKAAGCYPPNMLFGTILDFANHWQSQGITLQKVMAMSIIDQLDSELI